MKVFNTNFVPKLRDPDIQSLLNCMFRAIAIKRRTIPKCKYLSFSRKWHIQDK